MKRTCRLLIIGTVLLLLFNVYPQVCAAQIGDPGEDPDAPIDGGIGLLIAAGVGYGIKKANDRRKKNSTVHLPEKN